jgi:hypothetical protein
MSDPASDAERSIPHHSTKWLRIPAATRYSAWIGVYGAWPFQRKGVGQSGAVVRPLVVGPEAEGLGADLMGMAGQLISGR